VRAFEDMVASLTGVGGPPDRSAALREAAVVLRTHGSAASQVVADGLDRWLREGGPLDLCLGVNVARGRSSSLPHRKEKAAAVRKVLVELANQVLPGASPKKRAEAVAKLIAARSPEVLILHQGPEPLPSSAVQIARILRSGGG
jgi:hypothetical protein